MVSIPPIPENNEHPTITNLPEKQKVVFDYLMSQSSATATQTGKALNLVDHRARHLLQSLALKGLVYFNRQSAHWHSCVAVNQERKKWLMSHRWS